MKRAPLHLMTHREALAVARLGPGEEPSWDHAEGPLVSVSRSAGETSVICLDASVPAGVVKEGPFRAVEVAGPLDFTMIGVLHGILEPLVGPRIPVLTVSTYDTDWILVPVDREHDAVAAWRRSGFIVTGSHLSNPGTP